jgi:hypothetical protein
MADYSSLYGAADVIATETKEYANTAERVGGWMKDMLKWVSDNLKNHSDGAIAGSGAIWFGATAPTGYAFIPEVQSNDYSMTDYADLWNNLGGLNSPWGYDTNAGKFSLPWGASGISFIKAGSIYALASTGGNSSVNLTVNNLAPFKVRIGVNNGGAGSLEWTNPDTTSGARKYPLASQATSTYSSGFSDSIGQGTPLNIQPPYVAVNWIIKLSNDDNSFNLSINDSGHLIVTYSDGSTQDAGQVMNPNCVLSSAQTLTPAQQSQTQKNIGVLKGIFYQAAGSGTIKIPIPVNTKLGDVWISIDTLAPLVFIADSSGDLFGATKIGNNLNPLSINKKYVAADLLTITVSGGTIDFAVEQFNF